jgi:hypothetical protein
MINRCCLTCSTQYLIHSSPISCRLFVEGINWRADIINQQSKPDQWWGAPSWANLCSRVSLFPRNLSSLPSLLSPFFNIQLIHRLIILMLQHFCSYYHVSGFAWLIIIGSGFYDWIYWHFFIIITVHTLNSIRILLRMNYDSCLTNAAWRISWIQEWTPFYNCERTE